MVFQLFESGLNSCEVSKLSLGVVFVWNGCSVRTVSFHRRALYLNTSAGWGHIPDILFVVQCCIVRLLVFLFVCSHSIVLCRHKAYLTYALCIVSIRLVEQYSIVRLWRRWLRFANVGDFISKKGIWVANTLKQVELFVLMLNS